MTRVCPMDSRSSGSHSRTRGGSQLCVFGLGSDEDGDVRIGVFPERKKVLVCHRVFRNVMRSRVGSRELKMGQRTHHKISHNAMVIEQFLEFGGRALAIVHADEGLAA